MPDRSSVALQVPQSTAAETVAREIYQALLAALSNPGRSFPLPGGSLTTRQSCQQIGLTLLDLETSFFTPDSALTEHLKQSGARPLPAAQAAYLFFPDGVAFAGPALAQTLAAIEQSAVGTITDPDQGATLIVACRLGAGEQLHLSGPGIQQTIDAGIGGLPDEFWQLRNAKINYPLGIDLFLIDGAQVVGLPRTTILSSV